MRHKRIMSRKSLTLRAFLAVIWCLISVLILTRNDFLINNAAYIKNDTSNNPTTKASSITTNGNPSTGACPLVLISFAKKECKWMLGNVSLATDICGSDIQCLAFIKTAQSSVLSAMEVISAHGIMFLSKKLSKGGAELWGKDSEAHALSKLWKGMHFEEKGLIDEALFHYRSSIELDTLYGEASAGVAWQAAHRGASALRNKKSWSHLGTWCRLSALLLIEGGFLKINDPQWNAVGCDVHSFISPTKLFPEIKCTEDRGILTLSGVCKCHPGFYGSDCQNGPDHLLADAHTPPTIIRVCLITMEFGDLALGGIGTAFTELSKFLARQGFHVTVLWLGHPNVGDGKFLAAQQEFESKYGINLYSLESQNKVKGRPHLVLAYEAYQWLAQHEQDFDVVHYHEWFAPGFFISSAKKQGFKFQDITLIVQVHGMWIWALHNQKIPGDGRSHELSFAEIKSMENADLLVSCSQYMVDDVLQTEMGINIAAEQIIVVPNLMQEPSADSIFTQNIPHTRVKVDEVVFFGKTDLFKGIDIFCDAIDALIETGKAPGKVSFLVRIKPVIRDGKNGDAYIKDRTKKWRNSGIIVNIVTGKNSQDSMVFLAEHGRIAVMPSVLENSPYVVLECITHNIPFIATSVGGTSELIHMNDTGKVLVEYSVSAIATKIDSALTHGAHLVRLRKSLKDVENTWLGLHIRKRRVRTESRSTSRPTNLSKCSTELTYENVPLVSVVVTAFDRPVELFHVVESIWHQNYAAIEVIIVDDASKSKEEKRELLHLQNKYNEELRKTQVGENSYFRSLKVVHNKVNKYLAVSRNIGSDKAIGELIVFVDDDDPLMKHAIKSMALALCNSGADVVGARPWYYPYDKPMDVEADYIADWLVVGGSLTNGVVMNSFNGPLMIIRKGAFNAVGKFSNLRAGCEDWEFWVRAWLFGLNIDKVVEPVYWYREGHPSSMFKTMSKFDCNKRIADTYRAVMPPGLESLPEFTQVLASVAPNEYT